MAERLLTVEDAFVAKGAGIVVMPRFTTASAPKGKFAIELRFANGARREITAEVDVAHMRGPLPPYAMYRLHGIHQSPLNAGARFSMNASTPSR